MPSSVLGARALQRSERSNRRTTTPRQRTDGYEAALTEAGILIKPSHLQPAAHSRRADGYNAARTLLDLDRRPDAIFCFSDVLATGAIRAVFNAGLRVPEDVAIIGIDDLGEGRYSRPSLSTVSLDTPFIAHHAVARIAARIDDPNGRQKRSSHLTSFGLG